MLALRPRSRKSERKSAPARSERVRMRLLLRSPFRKLLVFRKDAEVLEFREKRLFRSGVLSMARALRL